MFLFTILLMILLILIVVTVAAISIFGAGAIIIFGDVIVCGVIIGLIIKKVFFS